MSTTMDCVIDTRNAAQVRNSDSATPEQVTSHMNTPGSSATEHRGLAGLLSGFVVVDKDGGFIAWAACPIVAKNRLDADPLAQSFMRCADDVLMGWKHGKRKASL